MRICPMKKLLKMVKQVKLIKLLLLRFLNVGRLLVYIESIASPAMGNQPSWAHVVKGGVSVVPLPPPPLPTVQDKPQLFRNPYKATSDILIAAKAALKAVPVEIALVVVAAGEHGDHGAGKGKQSDHGVSR